LLLYDAWYIFISIDTRKFGNHTFLFSDLTFRLYIVHIQHSHPFLDGNGRTARVLYSLILYQNGYDFKRLFSLSEYYDKDRRKCYDTIQSVREIDNSTYQKICETTKRAATRDLTGFVNRELLERHGEERNVLHVETICVILLRDSNKGQLRDKMCVKQSLYYPVGEKPT